MCGPLARPAPAPHAHPCRSPRGLLQSETVSVTFLSVPAPLQRALVERGYKDPTPVQAAVLQPEVEGRDLVVSAQTGSGKTVAYGLALAPTLMTEGEIGRASCRER